MDNNKRHLILVIRFKLINFKIPKYEAETEYSYEINCMPTVQLKYLLQWVIVITN